MRQHFSAVEHFFHGLMPAAGGERLFSILAESHQNRRVLNREQDGAVALRFVEAFVLPPAVGANLS
jgi:hypothetical protein